MRITKKTITVEELIENYSDDGDNGVYGFNGKLCIRPEYQRSFIYSDKKRNMVLDTVRKGFPLGLMYWNLKPDGNFECLDGQQRTISISQYVNGDFAIKVDGNDKFFHNLTDTEKEDILKYELEIRVCEGTEEEKLEWFKVINIAGEVLTNQELLNATFVGPWLADAKNYFSKRNCVAAKMAEGYVKGNPIRQDYLEKALSWIADRDNLKSGQVYMAIHQHDEDANDLWLYYQSVINWAKMMFPKVRKGITDTQDWGILYNKYHNNRYNTNTLETDIQTLIMDDDVTKNAGIIPYILSPRTKFDEKTLSIRQFTPAQKLRAYEKQNHKCPYCVVNGIEIEYAFEDMEGDHIVPWSKGGRTTEDNLQMLCTRCNNDKSNR